jgi:hypothetical protein
VSKVRGSYRRVFRREMQSPNNIKLCLRSARIFGSPIKSECNVYKLVKLDFVIGTRLIRPCMIVRNRVWAVRYEADLTMHDDWGWYQEALVYPATDSLQLLHMPLIWCQEPELTTTSQTF